MRLFWTWFLGRKKWTIEGSYPYELPKLVMAVAPHTHWHDFVLGLAVRSVMRLGFVRYLGKQELFDGPFGFFFRRLGGIPVNRRSRHGLVEQVVAMYQRQDSLALALSPEGTRKRVDRLKTGFYHIARQAGVPLLLVGFDFGSRRVVFSEPFFPSDDADADFRHIHRFFSAFQGKIPEQGLQHLAEAGYPDPQE